MAINMAKNMVRLRSSINWILESPLILWLKIQDGAPSSVQLPKILCKGKRGDPKSQWFKTSCEPAFGRLFGRLENGQFFTGLMG